MLLHEATKRTKIGIALTSCMVPAAVIANWWRQGMKGGAMPAFIRGVTCYSSARDAPRRESL